MRQRIAGGEGVGNLKQVGQDQRDNPKSLSAYNAWDYGD